MIPKSFGLLFYLKKQRGNAKGERPIYLRITIDGVLKEMSVQAKPGTPSSVGSLRPAEPLLRSPPAGRRPAFKQPQPLTPDDEAQALNAYLDTLQAKVHEARHQLLMGGKPITAEAVRNIIQGKEASGERPHLLLEIFQYHNDQVKALVGKEYSKGTLTKFNSVLRAHPGFSCFRDGSIRRTISTSRKLDC